MRGTPVGSTRTVSFTTGTVTTSVSARDGATADLVCR